MMDPNLTEEQKISAVQMINSGQKSTQQTPQSAAMQQPQQVPQAPMPEAMPQAQPQQVPQAPGLMDRIAQAIPNAMPSFGAGINTVPAAGQELSQAADMAGPTFGEGIGSMIGGLAGPAGAVLGGAVGAGAGLIAGRTASGQSVSPGEVATEAGLSLLPEALEPVGRKFLRYLIKGSKSYKQVAMDTAHDIATKMGKVAFDPPQREAVDNMFNMVRQSGMKVDTSGVAQLHLDALDDTDMKRLRVMMDDIGAHPKDPTGPKPGARVFAQLEAAKKAGGGIGIDIGDLQNVRSSLSKQIAYDQGHISANNELAERAVSMIDSSIEEALQAGGKNEETAKLLKSARAQWHRYRAAEDMGTLTAKLSNWDDSLEFQRINLAGLKKALDTPQTKLQQNVRRSLDSIPGAKDEIGKSLERMSKIMKTIEVDVPKGTNMAVMAGIGGAIGGPMGAMAGAAGGASDMINLPRALGTILANRHSREALERIALEKRGVIPYGTYAMLFNAARRAAQVELLQPPQVQPNARNY